MGWDSHILVFKLISITLTFSSLDLSFKELMQIVQIKNKSEVKSLFRLKYDKLLLFIFNLQDKEK